MNIDAMVKLTETMNRLGNIVPGRARWRRILVATNLRNAGSVGGNGHCVKTSGFLTSTTITKTLGVDINANGTSMDQIAARRSEGGRPCPRSNWARLR